MITIKPNNIDDYITCFPKETQVHLKQMRTIINVLAPDADESISYGMPAYKTYGKPLIYFAGYKITLGFMQHQPDMKNLKKSYQITSKVKDLFNFL